MKHLWNKKKILPLLRFKLRRSRFKKGLEEFDYGTN
jgi:hypothetical protein